MLSLALTEAWRMFKNMGLMGFLTLTFLTLTMAIGLASLTLLRFINRWTSGTLSQVEMEVFFETDADSSLIENAKRLVMEIPEVESLRVVTPDMAKQRFSELYNPELFDLLTYNPLPYSLILTFTPPQSTDRDWSHRWETIANKIRLLPGVEEVVYQGFLLAKWETLFRQGRKWGLGIALLFTFFTFLSTLLTFRGVINSHRGFIRTLLLSGGTQGTVRSPFILLGILYSIVAGASSVSIIYLLAHLLSWGWSLTLSLHLPDILLVLGGGLMVSLVATSAALSKLKIVEG